MSQTNPNEPKERTSFLETAIGLQQELQLRLHGAGGVVGDRKALEMVDFMIEEAVELRKELPRKSWKQQPSPTTDPAARARAKSELIDVLLFWLNTAAALGFTGEELEAEYFRVRANCDRRADWDINTADAATIAAVTGAPPRPPAIVPHSASA